MKLTGVNVALGTLIFCVGCSHTKTVNVLSQSWGIGQHQDCLYVRQSLYCLPNSLKQFDIYFLDGNVDKDKKPVPRTDVLFHLSVDIVHYMERNRPQLEQDPTSGTYEVAFSASPSDYAVWDCYKTGSGRPAIDCRLTNEADRAERERIAKREKMARMDDILRDLVPETLTKNCASPQQTSNDNISLSLTYPSTRPSVSLKLKFDTYKDTIHLSVIESSEPKGPDGRYASGHIFWWRDGDSIDESQRVMEALPCLGKQ